MEKGEKKKKIVLKIFYLWHKILILILIHTHKESSFPTIRKEEGTGLWLVLRLLIVEAEPGK